MELEQFMEVLFMYRSFQSIFDFVSICHQICRWKRLVKFPLNLVVWFESLSKKKKDMAVVADQLITLAAIHELTLPYTSSNSLRQKSLKSED